MDRQSVERHLVADVMPGEIADLPKIHFRLSPTEFGSLPMSRRPSLFWAARHIQHIDLKANPIMSNITHPDLCLTDDEFMQEISQDDFVDDLSMDAIIEAMHDDWRNNLGADLILALKD